MKFMIILRGNEQTEAGVMPSEKMLTDMNKFNEELVDAGVMVGGEGLHPAKEGVCVTFKNGEPTIKEEATPGVMAGFWLWKLDSMDEAIDWVKRIPTWGGEMDGDVEIRQIYETEEFSDVMSPEAMEQEKRLKQRIDDQNAQAASGQ